MGTSQAFLQGPLFESLAHIVPVNHRLFRHSPFIIAFAIIKHIFACSCVHVCFSQLDHELPGDGSNVPQVSVGSRPLYPSGLAQSLVRGVQANSALHAAIERHCSLPLQDNQLQENGCLSASRSSPFGVTTLSQQGHPSPRPLQLNGWA